MWPFACSVWTAGLRSYVSSMWDWQLIALRFNLVRDFQKCCVHSDLEIRAPCSLCVENFDAPKKKRVGGKGPPWWCHSTVSKQGLVAGEGSRTGHTVTKIPPGPSSPWHSLNQPEVQGWPYSFNLPVGNSNPHSWFIYVLFSWYVSPQKTSTPIWLLELSVVWKCRCPSSSGQCPVYMM